MSGSELEIPGTDSCRVLVRTAWSWDFVHDPVPHALRRPSAADAVSPPVEETAEHRGVVVDATLMPQPVHDPTR